MTTATQATGGTAAGKKRATKPEVEVQVFASAVQKDGPEGEPHVRADEMSGPEKQMLCIIVNESDPLPYPLKPLKMAYGPDEQVYDIPEEVKAAVFGEVWPFHGCPALDDLRFDLHEQKVFKFRDAQVIRHNGRNLIVSPYYAHSGGMTVDFMPPEVADSEDKACVLTTKE